MIDLDSVKRRLHITETSYDQELKAIAAAVESLVTQWLGSGNNSAVMLGAEMLAARLWQRRNSPAGLESISEVGPVYVSRNDPDIAQLLGLGAHRRPVVA